MFASFFGRRAIVRRGILEEGSFCRTISLEIHTQHGIAIDDYYRQLFWLSGIGECHDEGAVIP